MVSYFRELAKNRSKIDAIWDKTEYFDMKSLEDVLLVRAYLSPILSLSLSIFIHTHTHTHTYLYIYVCVCLCLCACDKEAA